MNPEFQRNIWLELTPHRLLAAPVFLAAVFGLIALVSGDDVLGPLSHAAWWIAAATGVLWGARLAADAVLGEVHAGTWDQQRLSSIRPWAMTWGKPLCAPVFTWYVAAPCLVLVAAGGSARMALSEALAHTVLLVLI